ncbi:DegT/DnrJ/EryC1/StrS aminotransferase family protein [Kribbella sp. VKM Ac-2568]|uniref:DegT/DnrJ/EryC1/StrS family aminotransferase n=1 Tax=Kribbella sp. VKM Ac-2568 TaxID=2512219 RepID=UPI001051AEE8|nr:DegT/DnrJ/EryC1/StrS family aminotransferase [Kribbella sp. VKM Ac-2568]TCM46754.1 dTDP-4-amino-4,6-dideoxygalactose transaminase [Kribbella sp. VKM Ac-2568]
MSGSPVRRTPLPGVLEPAGRTFGEEEREAVLRVLDSAVLCSTFGGEARALEAEMEDLYGRTAVACSSGTAALHLAVAAVRFEPGDEVITTPISDFGTVAPILAQNGVPVFADVDPATGNLDPAAVEAAITPRTKAIIAVHLFGAPADIVALRAIADRHGLLLIEDCAQAWLGTTADGELLGRFGDISCFSLQQYKHISAGDGGLAVTADPELAARMRLFMDKGWDRANGRVHLMLGLNYRMTELVAAVARAQLGKVAGVVERRRERAAQLLAALEDLPGLGLPEAAGHAWWLFPLIVPGNNRAWADGLAAEGVPAAAGYLDRTLYANPIFTEAPVYGNSRYPLDRDYPPGLCPNAERLIQETLVALPWNEAYTKTDVDDIAQTLRKVHAGV